MGDGLNFLSFFLSFARWIVYNMLAAFAVKLTIFLFLSPSAVVSVGLILEMGYHP